MQLSVLDPTTNVREKMNEQLALERLISRDTDPAADSSRSIYRAHGTEAGGDCSAARTRFARSCRHAFARIANRMRGWKAFLTHHELTPAQVENYMRLRIEILSFIELRFRQGIRITPEEIETYYTGTLLPQYPAGEKPPPLQQVSSRIEEILLQQRVNALFDNWLSNLRKQGQIEVLDPALETADANGQSRERRRNERDRQVPPVPPDSAEEKQGAASRVASALPSPRAVGRVGNSAAAHCGLWWDCTSGPVLRRLRTSCASD